MNFKDFLSEAWSDTVKLAARLMDLSDKEKKGTLSAAEKEEIAKVRKDLQQGVADQVAKTPVLDLTKMAKLRKMK